MCQLQAQLTDGVVGHAQAVFLFEAREMTGVLHFHVYNEFSVQ